MQNATHGTCGGCRRVKPADEFYQTRGKVLWSRCKTCHREKSAERRNTPRHKELYAARYKQRWLEYLVQAAKQRATARGVKFALGPAWIKKHRHERYCALTGLALEIGNGRTNGVPSGLAPSIDRKNPLLGYTPRNVRIVCWWANMAKGRLTDAELKLFVAAAASKMLH